MKAYRSASIVLLAILSIVYFRVLNPNWGKGNYGVISYDDYGYYLYLPATFIYNDIQLKDEKWINDLQEKYRPSYAFYQAHKRGNGSRVIQYTMGMSMMYSPAFFLSHIYSNLDSNYPADGLSTPYQIGLLAYSFIWLAIGLVFLRRFLLFYFSDKITALLLLTLIAGTNYFQIAINNTTSPHIYLFTNYSILLYFTHLWYRDHKRIHLVIVSIFFGITVLSRPNELLFLVVLLLWGITKKEELKDRFALFAEHKKDLLIGSAIVIGIGLLQVIYWLALTKKVVHDSYIFENFKLTDPYLIEYLFSYKKGWLLYTPIAFLFFISYYFLYKKEKRLFYPFLLFGLVNIWILSSWDCWWYADSFSQRSIVQTYPMYLFPLGFLYSSVYQKIRIPAVALSLFLLACMSLNLFQTWQQRKGIIHTLRMNKEYYWEVFGTTKYDPSKLHLLEYPRGKTKLPDSRPELNSMIHYTSFEAEKVADNSSLDSIAHDGLLILNKERNAGEMIVNTFESLKVGIDIYYVMNLRFKLEGDYWDHPFSVVTEVKDHRDNKVYGWGGANSNQMDPTQFKKTGDWYELQAAYVPPYYRSEKDTIYTYLKYWGEGQIYFDDFSIQILGDSTDLRPDHTTYIQNYNNLKQGLWKTDWKWIVNNNYEKVFASNPYSSTLVLNELDKLSFKKLNFKVHLLNRKSDKTYLVVKVEKAGELLAYENIYIPPSIEWQSIDYSYKLLANYPEGSELKFYVWNESGEEAFINYLKCDYSNR